MNYNSYLNYNRDLKKFKEWEWVKTIVYNFVLALFFTLVILILSTKIFNFRIDEVLSDSMYPAFTDQDIVIISKADDYKVGTEADKNGDIIEFKKGNHYFTHRIIGEGTDSVGHYYLVKGDNTGTGGKIDTVYDKDILGRVIMIWYNGRFTYQLISENYGLVLAIVIGAWGISYILSNEKEIKSHDVTAD